MTRAVVLGRAARLVPLLGGVALAACAGRTPAPATPASAATPTVRTDALPAWVAAVGARRRPDAARSCPAHARGAVGDGATKSTRAVQQAIDACATAGGGTVHFAPGQYVVGALFLKTGVHLRLDSGVTLLGSQDDADYPVMPTRVAGIEMPWPAALINVLDQRNVRISGRGVIDGRGQRWWDL